MQDRRRWGQVGNKLRPRRAMMAPGWPSCAQFGSMLAACLDDSCSLTRQQKPGKSNRKSEVFDYFCDTWKGWLWHLRRCSRLRCACILHMLHHYCNDVLTFWLCWADYCGCLAAWLGGCLDRGWGRRWEVTMGWKVYEQLWPYPYIK